MQSPAALLLKRARARYLTMPLAVSLAKLKTGKVYRNKAGQVTGELETRYRNTCYCTAVLTQEGGKIMGKYCGNRWCLVCSRIRTARAINRYQPVVEGWTDRWFVTLTLRNVAALDLPDTIDDMIRDTQTIKLGMRRTDKVKLVALRKLECTHNAEADTYHPHFHFLVDGRRAAELLLSRWMALHPHTSDLKGQNIKRCDAGDLREIFKYFTKLVTRKKVNGSAVSHRRYPIPPDKLDVIFRAMQGRRVYQPVGFVVASDAPDENADTVEPELATRAPTLETIQWEWSQRCTDWVDRATGECLTGYEPAEKFRRFVDRIGGHQTTADDVDQTTEEVLARMSPRRPTTPHQRRDDDGELEHRDAVRQRWQRPGAT